MSCYILHLCSFFSKKDVVTNFANSLRSFHFLLLLSVSSMMHYMCYHWIGFGNFQGCTDRKVFQSKGKSVHYEKSLKITILVKNGHFRAKLVS